MELEHRIIRLEFLAENHNEELKDLRDISKNLSVSVVNIEKNIQQIKMITTGAIIMFLAQSMGVSSLFKAIFL
jgi:predicted chitinase